MRIAPILTLALLCWLGCSSVEIVDAPVSKDSTVKAEPTSTVPPAPGGFLSPMSTVATATKSGFGGMFQSSIPSGPLGRDQYKYIAGAHLIIGPPGPGADEEEELVATESCVVNADKLVYPSDPQFAIYAYDMIEDLSHSTSTEDREVAELLTSCLEQYNQ